jgi:hypothetical protein
MTAPQPTRPNAPSGMVAVLTRLRATARAQLITQRVGLLMAAFVAYVILAAMIDYFLRMPVAVRLVLWAGSVGVLAYLIRKYIVPALTFRPSLTQVALRVEQSEEGRKAGLTGVLASALELTQGEPESVLGAELRLMSAEEARRRFTISTSALLTRRRLGQALAALVTVAVPTAALVLTVPELARIGTARVLTPWSSAAWPKRTGVIDANPIAAHPAGTALPLRAILSRNQKGHANVAVTYRVVTNGRAGITQHALLTSQNKTVSFEPVGGAPPVHGELYERLLDTASMVPAHAPGTPPPTVKLEYFFETSDDRTEWASVTLVEPPAVIAGSVEVTPPDYAAAALAAHADGPNTFFRGTVEVGAGRDERAHIGPILAGSRVTLDLTLNKPLPVPPQEPGSDWLRAALPGLEEVAERSVELEPTRWRVSFTARNNLRLPVILKDSYGISASEDAVYRFDVIEDRPPAAAVVEPSQDEAVLPTAIIEAAGEGRDDVGLASVSLHWQVARPPAGSAGAPPEPLAEPVRLSTMGSENGTALVLRAPGTVDITTLGAIPGDEVWLTTQAVDIFAAADPSRGPSISGKRRLRIISESDLIEQFRSELAGVREAAKRLEADQDRLGQLRAEAGKDSQKAGEQAQRQAAITDRLGPLADAIERLANRAERNRLDDKSVQALLRDAAEFVQSATEKSDIAAGALDRLAGMSPSESREQDQRTLEAAQQGVQEDLSQLANMLDRGQDTWAVKRGIEKLLAEQKTLTAQTAGADPSMKGQDAQSLTPEQREELTRLAQRQEELAQRAGALVDQLQQRAEQMRQVDAAQAQAMQNAADRAREQRVDQKQQDAAEQIRENRTDAAQEQQRAAERALQTMLEALERAEQQRDEALRRVLADLIESLDKLIQQQESELSRLGAAMNSGAPDKTLDVGMIFLNQNTLGVLATVQAMREAAQVVEYIDSASSAQAAAIVALRASDYPEADANERISLARLKDARNEAQKLEDEAEEREADRRREELRRAYMEALELEVALRAETAPLLGKTLDRRERQTARLLAERQEAIRQSLAALRSSTQEMDEARMFDYAHARLDATTAQIAKTLSEGSAPQSVGRDQGSVIRILQGLVAAVEEMQRKKDDFREEESGGGDAGGGGGGSGEQPLIPPIAELKLLRFMQVEAAELTRAADESSDAALAETVMRLQRELADQAKALLERMQEEQPRVPAPTPAPEPPQ